jgi:hypothetical protein
MDFDKNNKKGCNFFTQKLHGQQRKGIVCMQQSEHMHVVIR